LTTRCKADVDVELLAASPELNDLLLEVEGLRGRLAARNRELEALLTAAE
jgi:hypothetical protein